MKARRDVKVEHLREALLLNGSSDDALRRIAQMADEIAVPAGYVLVYEGDWGNEVFVVADGEARVTAGGRTLAVLGASAVIGELPLFNPSPRTATVTASTPMRFFVFDSDSFDVVLEEFPLIARRMVSNLAGWFESQSGELAGSRGDAVVP
jgi:CRP/FNR family transcriptional regulator